MNLVRHRDLMKQDYENGKVKIQVLEVYRQNRNSEMWRTSLVVESLCEYILFLEQQLESRSKPV